MYLVQFHPYSNPERSQRKHEENATEFGGRKDTSESIEMDKGSILE